MNESWFEMGWGGARDIELSTKIRKSNSKHGTFGRQHLLKVIRSAVEEYRATMVKRKTIYAITQLPLPLPASTGADGAGSASGKLEVME